MLKRVQLKTTLLQMKVRAMVLLHLIVTTSLLTLAGLEHRMVSEIIIQYPTATCDQVGSTFL